MPVWISWILRPVSAIAAVIVILAMFFLPGTSASASVNPTGVVRVGLLMRNAVYDNSVDNALLSGTGGLHVGFFAGGSFVNALDFPSSPAVVASLDDFYLVVDDTTNWNTVAADQSKLQALGMATAIHVENRKGVNNYQLIQGYYEQYAEAQAAQAKVQAVLGAAPRIAGWYRFSAGSFPTLAAAQSAVNAYRAQGFDCYPVVRQNAAGQNSFEVWVGNAGTPAERDALKQQFSAGNPGVAVSNADFSTNYFLIKTDYAGTDSGGNIVTTSHLLFESVGEQLVFAAVSSPYVVTVLGTKGPQYRGYMVLEGNRERMAVINQLPVDQYLYGVVPREMASGWPMEALKAQAVAARNYVLSQPAGKWDVCQVVDNTYDQEYDGYSAEAPDTNAAVDATRGQVLMYDNGTPSNPGDDQLVNALFASNHGGMSASDSAEVFGSDYGYLQPVPSPWDRVELQAENDPVWDLVSFSNGWIGYVRSDLVTDSHTKNSAGYELGTINAQGTNVRDIPTTRGNVIAQANAGDVVAILETAYQNDSYVWISGPFSPADIASEINSYTGMSLGPVANLQVAQYGPSGRVVSVSADGQTVTFPAPDNFRGMFGLRSTKFTVDARGTYSILGATASVNDPQSAGGAASLYVVSASNSVPVPVNGDNSLFVIQSASGTRVASKQQVYYFHGYGYGHGLGMSQWGAYGMALQKDANGNPVYTYVDILEHYYPHTYLTPRQ
jgi:stage II sporulation protein D